MEVGIEDCLHIEFEYNKSKYHLKDAIIGKIYFLLVRIKVKYMELAIMKREIIGDNAQVETESVAKYEIMDGAPVKGESIPIRLFLGGYDLTPSMRDVQKKFSCKYYLNLVLVDEEDRRYFKQQEITLWRKADKYKSKLERSEQVSNFILIEFLNILINKFFFPQMQVYESSLDQLKDTKQASNINNNNNNNSIIKNDDGIGNNSKTPQMIRANYEDNENDDDEIDQKEDVKK